MPYSESIKPGTKTISGVDDLLDYIKAFNRDDFDHYCCYYAKDVKMDFATLPDDKKNLDGYLNWVTPMHKNIQETLNPQTMLLTRDSSGKLSSIKVKFFTKFHAKNNHSEDNFLGRWGPIYPEDGPLVKMIVTYTLNESGHVIKLGADSKLVDAAAPKEEGDGLETRRTILG